ncbi:DUF1810 family protein [Aliihoeflea sp. 2WW]|uniref:DUF1810 family protein n=1 Tax=Aliihoeflea sp. 2WW TaxID=1381123 RepID=UPI0009DD0C1D|nr:DUF1810 family protein [Aliihoeflea sp. 2WW]
MVDSKFCEVCLKHLPKSRQADDRAGAVAEISPRPTTRAARHRFPRGYGIASVDEARAACLQISVLGPRLILCSQTVLEGNAQPLHYIFGPPDDLKSRSSMTLFQAAAPNQTVRFWKALGGKLPFWARLIRQSLPGLLTTPSWSFSSVCPWPETRHSKAPGFRLARGRHRTVRSGQESERSDVRLRPQCHY